MTFGSLFSGAGGFDLGFEAAGMSCSFQCEIDRTANDVLARHWPNVPKQVDVREAGKKNLPRVDVLVGGFPCQDLSVAGQRKGLQGGTRSGLFYELARIAVELRPRFVVFENVPGLLSSDDGRDFARVLRHLGDSGFHGGWRVLDAEGFGVAQHRRRVFGVFTRERTRIGCCAEILALRESVSRDFATGREAGADVAGTLGGGAPGRGWSDDLERAGAFIPQISPAVSAKWAKGSGGPSGDECQNLIAFTVSSANSCEKVSHARPTNTTRALDTTGGYAPSQGGTVVVGALMASGAGTERVAGMENESSYLVHDGISVRRLTPRECERLMGWPDDHTRYRHDGREIADGPRYRLCGNGVVGTVAAWIGRRLMDAA